VENAPNGQKARIVGCLLNVLVGPENPEALLARLADRETAIVTVSVTEKGYTTIRLRDILTRIPRKFATTSNMPTYLSRQLD